MSDEAQPNEHLARVMAEAIRRDRVSSQRDQLARLKTSEATLKKLKSGLLPRPAERQKISAGLFGDPGVIDRVATSDYDPFTDEVDVPPSESELLWRAIRRIEKRLDAIGTTSATGTANEDEWDLEEHAAGNAGQDYSDFEETPPEETPET